ncbi:MAG: metal-dependent transcriptional regulator [Deltaproteobacteria bacterium]|nr:metal-dependent transcriptional regulator [Deltaproteobacteria bacterium]
MTQTEKKVCTSSLEDYIEAIAQIKGEKRVARVKEIGEFLGVTKPSVNRAISRLVDLGLAVHEHYGYVDLTDKGQELARDVIVRHKTILDFLVKVLRLDEDTAQDDACKMEHVLSKETMERLVKFVEFVSSCPMAQEPRWIKHFEKYLKTGERNCCGCE